MKHGKRFRVERSGTSFLRFAADSGARLVKVFSTHRQAINLVPTGVDVDASLGRPVMLSIVSEKPACTRNSLLIGDATVDLSGLGLARGEHVTLDSTQTTDGIRLELSPVAKESSASLIFLISRTGDTYSGQLPDAPAFGTRSLPKDATRILAHSIAELDDGSGFAPLCRLAVPTVAGESAPYPNPFAARAAELLTPAFEGRRPTRAALSSLIGLGTGFTPSGDDFVAGYLLGCELKALHDPKLPTLLGSRLQEEATTLPGAALVTDALSAAFPSFLVDFVTTLLRRNASELPAAVGYAARHGHSSGLDSLTGVLSALVFGMCA